MARTTDYFTAIEARERKLDYLGIKDTLTDDELIDLLVRISSTVEALADVSGVSLSVDFRGRVRAQNRLTGEVSYGTRF